MESLQKRPATDEEAWKRAEEELRKMHGGVLSIERVDGYDGSERVYRVNDSLEFGYVYAGNGCLLFRLDEN